MLGLDPSTFEIPSYDQNSLAAAAAEQTDADLVRFFWGGREASTQYCGHTVPTHLNVRVYGRRGASA